MLNIFLFNNFFEKSSIFRENCEKLFWRCIRQFFRGRRRLAPKINITFFITNEVLNILLFSSFFKVSCNFQRERQKTAFGAQVFFERNENEYNLFYGKWGFEFFSFDNVFEKSNILEKIGKKILWGHGHFLGKGVTLTLKVNITFFIEN